MLEISVVMPFYNSESFAREALAMVLGQSFEDLEIIAVDDGSTDGTLAVLEDAAANNKRVRVFTEENGGPGVARNTGLSKATGRYVLFLDPDDCFHTDMLEKLHDRAVLCDADIVVCASLIKDYASGNLNLADWTFRKGLVPAQQPFSPLDIPDDIFRFTIGWPWDKLFRRSFLSDKGIVFPPFRNSEDGPFVFSALLQAERIATVDEPLVDHVMDREGSVSFTRHGSALCFYDQIMLVRETMDSLESGERFQRAFLNWALDNCLWNLRTAHADDRAMVFAHLHDVVWPELGFANHDSDYYFVSDDYHSMLLLTEDWPDLFLESESTLKDYRLATDELSALRASRSYRLGNFFMRPAWKIANSFHRR